MSELKAFESERIYWAVEQVERVAGDIDSLHLDDNLFYIKSEADKVIANLEESHKMEVEQLLMEIVGLKDKLKNVSGLLKETREWLIESQKMHKRCADNAIKQILHQKYKRCLAMARWCETQFAYYIASCDRFDSKYVNKKAGHFYKWKYKWLELSEKFKEAK